ncbi:MAG: Nicotinate phosphoribosyltransferase pncB2 [Chlamydiae bacterium]|nr:Nicotinate phosphoribosyltransferase pncB2 [Chlamydiota bacterium]
MSSLYSHVSLALLTDLYEVTMAYGYWKKQMAEDEAVFHLFFRKMPFQGGFAMAAGLHDVIEFVKRFRFEQSDLDYLSTLQGNDGSPLFEPPFLDYLANLEFTCDIDAIPEGDMVFAYEPLVRVQGPIIQCQLLESALLTLTNFSTLIATKGARVSLATEGDSILEFGLRRAQGIDGALTASRAAFIGGCTATSNVFAGKMLGIPVKGTHAHSWIMAFETELESFQAYAEAMPENCVFLVDTYDTLQGVRNAIEVGKWLHEHGRPLLGIRLDSGDLNYLSIESRKMLDEAGFPEAEIFASNELNETLIADLKHQGAKIAVWGVGTNLVTGQTQSALDGVYKLSAYRKKGAEKWQYKLKLSEQMTKVSNPGILQIRRFENPQGEYVADALYDIYSDLSQGCTIVDPFDQTRQRVLPKEMKSRDVLAPIFRKGKQVYKDPSLVEIQAYGKEQLAKFDKSIKRFFNAHVYPVGMEKSLFEYKIKLVDKIRDRLAKSKK